MNFALILFVLLLISGALWALDHFVARKQRGAGAPPPWWVEYGASFFPVILVVFCLRSFVVEPFKIPSGSMLPTLLVGDFILVNKWTYGIRLPVINKKIVEINEPRRGDVMVFRFPADPSLDYIKRVVGLPGDKVEYLDKKLVINGVEMPQRPDGDFLHPDALDPSRQGDGKGADRQTRMFSPRFIEKLGTYDPLLPKDNENRVKIDVERVKYWLGEGAQATDRVSRFLEAAGVTEKKARNNPKQGEPGKAAVARAKERADKAAAAAAE